MATFIAHLKYTPQGIKAIGETTRRAAALKSAAKKMGVKFKDVFWTLGDYDGLLILEAADDETATAVLLKLGALGNVQTTTVRAFDAEEMDKILARLQA